MAIGIVGDLGPFVQQLVGKDLKQDTEHALNLKMEEIHAMEMVMHIFFKSAINQKFSFH